MRQNKKQKPWLIAPALLMIGLTGCESGVTKSTKIQVTPEFLDGLIAEQEGVARDYPYTASVVDDWIIQNEPK